MPAAATVNDTQHRRLEKLKADTMSFTYPRAINHLGLTVENIEAAKDWYCTVLGFETLIAPTEVVVGESLNGPLFAALFGPQLRRLKICHLVSSNGVGLELFEFIDPRSRRPADDFEYTRCGVFHLCVTDPDVAGLVQRVVDTGGRRISPQVLPSYPDTIYLASYCHDPFGNVIEVVSRSYEQQQSNRDPSVTRAY